MILFLKRFLEFTLKCEIDDIEIYPSELSNNNLFVKEKRVDVLVKAKDMLIEIEVNTNSSMSNNIWNMAYISNIYSNYVFKGEKYNDTKII